MSTTAGSLEPDACTPNIGPRGIARRRRTGIVALLATVVLAAALGFGGSGPAAQLWLFPGWLLAALGWLQAREKT
jgi:hypothetical protein